MFYKSDFLYFLKETWDAPQTPKRSIQLHELSQHLFDQANMSCQRNTYSVSELQLKHSGRYRSTKSMSDIPACPEDEDRLRLFLSVPLFDRLLRSQLWTTALLLVLVILLLNSTSPSSPVSTAASPRSSSTSTRARPAGCENSHPDWR